MNYIIIAALIMVFISIYVAEAKTETNLNASSAILYESQEEKAKGFLPHLFFFLVLLIALVMLYERWKIQKLR